MMAADLGSSGVTGRAMGHLGHSTLDLGGDPYCHTACVALFTSSSPPSSLLAVGDSGGHLRLCQDPISSARHEICPPVGAHRHIIYDLDWANDGSFIASASADGTICISTRTFSCLEPVLTLTSISGPVRTVACHPDDRHVVASGSLDGSVCVWDTRTQNRISISPLCKVNLCKPSATPGTCSVSGIEFVNPYCFLSCMYHGYVCLWDIRQLACPSMMTAVRCSAPNVHVRTLTCVRVSPCRTRAALLSTAGYCIVLTLPPAEDAECLAIPLSLNLGLLRECKLEWSPCGRYIACGSNDFDKCIHIIDMLLGQVELRLRHSSAVTDVAWFKDRTGIVSVGCDDLIHVWQPRMQPFLSSGYT
jgi:WD40 repeat protein